MILYLSLLMLAAVPSAFAHQPSPNSLQQVLGSSLSGVGIRQSPQMAAFARNFTTLMNQAIFESPGSATSGWEQSKQVLVQQAAAVRPRGSVSNGLVGIDSSMELLGPIFLSHGDTLGRGKLNLTALGSQSTPDSLYGESLDPLPEPGMLLLDGPDGQVTAALDFHVKVQEWVVGLSAGYGLTDNLDVNLLLPLIYSDLKIRASARVAGSVMKTETQVDGFGPGDVSLRLKHRWPSFWDIDWASTLIVQFPSGQPDLFHGTGDYWLSSGVLFHRILWKDRADLTLNLAMDFDVSNPTQSQALYGIGTSIMIWPEKLVGVLEFLGRSQLDSIHEGGTDVFYVRNGRTQKTPLFGIEFDRADYIDVAFGFRAFLGPVVVFAAGRYALNDGGVRDDDIEPLVGIGATF